MNFTKRVNDESEFKCWRSETEFVIARTIREARSLCAKQCGYSLEDYITEYGDEEWQAYESHETLTFVDTNGEWAECLKRGMKGMRYNDPLLMPKHATVSITAQARDWLEFFDDGKPHWLGSTEW